MEVFVRPCDLGAGDVIVLPGADVEVLVRAVRLGQGGFVVTVSPADEDSPEAERLITLTAGTRLRKRGGSRPLT